MLQGYARFPSAKPSAGFMNNLLLRQKLFLAMAAIVVVFSIVLLILIEFYVENLITAETVKDGKAISSGLALHAAPLMQHDELMSFDASVQEMMKANDGIEYVFIRRAGQTVFSTFRGGIPQELLALTHRADAVDFRRVAIGRKTFLDFSVPIEGMPAAYLRLGVDDRLGRDAIHEMMFFIFIVTILVILLAFVVSIIVAKRLTAPITELTASVSEIASGSLKGKVSVVGNDEISRLGRSFNKMVDAVKQREDEMNTLNSELEKVNVALRAHIEKLNAANEQIVKSKQDAAVVETARAFLHHLRQPLTYLTLAIDLLADEITKGVSLDYAAAKKKLEAIMNAGERLAELLSKFEALHSYKIIAYDNIAKIIDIDDNSTT